MHDETCQELLKLSKTSVNLKNLEQVQPLFSQESATKASLMSDAAA